MTRSLSLCVTLFGLALLVIGCSKNAGAPAKVSGSVTYNGKPVTAGTVSFHLPEGASLGAELTADGTYAISDVPEGELVVTVDTEAHNPTKKAASGRDADKRMKMSQQPPPPGMDAGPPPGAYVKIPATYSNPKSSPLKVTLTSGRNVYNIVLTD